MPSLKEDKNRSIPMLDGPIVEPRSGEARQMIIFLHGYGADGTDLIALSEEFRDALPDCVFLSPHAPFPCEISPMGLQWSSLRSYEHDFLVNQAKIVEPLIHKYIIEMLEAYDLEPKDLVIVGFSQGTIMGIYAALRLQDPIAGLVGFSGSSLQAPDQDDEVLSRFPVLLVHGKQDDILPFEHMLETKENLKRIGCDVETLPRPNLAHGIDSEGVDRAKEFLAKVFKV